MAVSRLDGEFPARGTVVSNQNYVKGWAEKSKADWGGAFQSADVGGSRHHLSGVMPVSLRRIEVSSQKC